MAWTYGSNPVGDKKTRFVCLLEIPMQTNRVLKTKRSSGSSASMDQNTMQLAEPALRWLQSSAAKHLTGK